MGMKIFIEIFFSDRKKADVLGFFSKCFTIEPDGDIPHIPGRIDY